MCIKEIIKIKQDFLEKLRWNAIQPDLHVLRFVFKYRIDGVLQDVAVVVRETCMTEEMARQRAIKIVEKQIEELGLELVA